MTPHRPDSVDHVDWDEVAKSQLARVMSDEPDELVTTAKAILAANLGAVLSTDRYARVRADSTQQAWAMLVRSVWSSIETVDLLSPHLVEGLVGTTLLDQRQNLSAFVVARAVIESAAAVIWVEAGGDPEGWSQRIIRLERTSQRYADQFSSQGGELAAAVSLPASFAVEAARPVQWGRVVQDAAEVLPDWEYPLSPLALWNLASGLAHGQTWAVNHASTPADAQRDLTQLIAGALDLASRAHEAVFGLASDGFQRAYQEKNLLREEMNALRGTLHRAWATSSGLP